MSSQVVTVTLHLDFSSKVQQIKEADRKTKELIKALEGLGV